MSAYLDAYTTTFFKPIKAKSATFHLYDILNGENAILNTRRNVD